MLPLPISLPARALSSRAADAAWLVSRLGASSGAFDTAPLPRPECGRGSPVGVASAPGLTASSALLSLQSAVLGCLSPVSW